MESVLTYKNEVFKNAYFKVVTIAFFVGIFVLNVGQTLNANNYPFLIIVGLSVLSAGYVVLKRGVRIIINKTWRFFLLFPLVCYISYFWADYPELVVSSSNVVLLTFIIITCFMCFFVELNITFGDICYLIMVAGIVSTVYLLLNYGGTYLWNIRNSSVSGTHLYNANSVGGVFFITSICAFISFKKKKSFILIAISLAYAVFGFITGSKTIIFSFLIFYYCLLLFSSRGSFKKVLVVLLIPLIIGCAYLVLFKIPFVYETIGYRFDEIIDFFGGDLEMYSSSWYRQDMIVKGLNLFAKRPFLGYGFGNSVKYNVYQWVYENGVYFHNNYVELLFGIGIIGALFYYSVFFFVLFRAIKTRKTNPYFPYIIAYTLTILIADLSSVSYLNRPTLVMILLCSLCCENKLQLENRYA